MIDVDKAVELLTEAEQYLGGFMGSSSAYKKVEELRAEIRAWLKTVEDMQSSEKGVEPK